MLILIIIGGVAALGFAYYAGVQVNKDIEPIVTIIDLTDSERKQITQDARLNWMPLDSAYALVDWALAQEGGIKWEIKDSTHWTFKDSINWLWNIKDSTVITYIPFYEAEDTIVNFDETVDEVRVELSLLIKPRFFPLYNRFLTETQLQELTVTQPAKIDSWWKHRWVLYAGYGISYAQKTCYGEQSWCWSNGFQLGLGIRLY